jgi:hypothetical protein
MPDVFDYDTPITTKASNVLEHDELYKVYPDLKNAEITYDQDMS